MAVVPPCGARVDISEKVGLGSFTHDNWCVIGRNEKHNTVLVVKHARRLNLHVSQIVWKAPKRPMAGDEVRVTIPGKCRFAGTVTSVSEAGIAVRRDGVGQPVMWPHNQVEVIE